MAILKKSKKVAKYVFVGMPMAVFGFSQLRLGNRMLRDLWASLRSVTCPQCKRGALICQQEERIACESDSAVRHPWICTNCDFALLEVADFRTVRDTVRAIRNQGTIELLGEMEFSARQKRSRQYAIQSRVFFVLAFAAFGWFLYNFALGAGLIYSANLGSLGLACAAVALKASYRSWQVETGTLFVESAFLHFLKHERWFR